jgi:hypothetical protein
MSDELERLWENETILVKDLDIYVPHWVDNDINLGTIAAIYEGGCASGAYMPAVTYLKASATMYCHGDDVLQHIEDAFGEAPSITFNEGWDSAASKLLSTAVELWAGSIIDEINDDLVEREEALSDEGEGEE